MPSVRSGAVDIHYEVQGAAEAPLVLGTPWAHLPPAGLWHSRMELVRREGMRAVAPAVIERWFTASFRSSHPEKVARIEGMLEATPPEGYATACGAIAEMNQLSDIRRIAASTLLICGAEDPATPLSHSLSLCDSIADSRLVVLPTAHLSNVERPQDFSAAVIDFLGAPANLP